MRGILKNIYELLFKRKLLAVFFFISLFLSLGFLASRITLEEDISSLLPRDSKTLELQKVLESVKFTDKIVVIISKTDSGTTENLTTYTRLLVDSLSKSTGTLISNIQGEVSDDSVLQTLDFVYAHLPLFLNEQDYSSIASKLSKDSIQEVLETNYKTLISPSGIIAKNTILKDPFGLSFKGLKKLETLGTSENFMVKDGFLMHRDERHILLFLSPKNPVSETKKNKELATTLYALQDDLNKMFTGKVRSEYFGAALVAVANANQIKHDIQYTISIALTILMLIFIAFYRKLLVPIILFIPTIFGGLLSIGVLYIVRGEISAISLGIGSVLLGVTLDYSIHILTHLRNKGTVKALYEEVAKSVLMSSFTTATAFLCLLFLDARALQDLGIFAAVSVLGASFFSLIFTPLVYKGDFKGNTKTTILDRLARFRFHESKLSIFIVIGFFVLAAFTYQDVLFNKDLSKLNYEPEAMVHTREKLDTLAQMGSKSLYLASYGSTTEKALNNSGGLHLVLKSLKEDGTIIDFNSPSAIVQSHKEQKKKFELWDTFWTPTLKDSLQSIMIKKGTDLGFKSNAYEPFYDKLKQTFTPISLESYNELSLVRLKDFITVQEDLTTITTVVSVKENKLSEVKTLLGDTKDTVLIDRQEMNEAFLGNLKNDFNALLVYSLIAVVLILFFFYKSFSLTLITAIPIFLSWFTTVGVMGALGIEFNIFNIIISTFIFGLGVDYSIFVTMGLLHEYRYGKKALSTHKTSILLSVITTLLGIGVLIFAKHPALYTISLVSVIGILAAVLISFTIQPLLFRLFIGSNNVKPVSLGMLLHSMGSFIYYGLGGLILSILGVTLVNILPLSKKLTMRVYHKLISKFMKSVLYSNPFVKKRVINEYRETFEKPAMLIANHTSFLDILAVGMLHPKIIFLVNDWVYNSPIFGRAVRLAGFYPVSAGIEKGVAQLQEKITQGYSLMAFPEGTRSKTNSIKRFHKGAFFLAEKLNLDIIPILIHGNSEVLPKGSFIIRNGSVTVQILNRISQQDATFGTTYQEQTKKISHHFKTAFSALRMRVEGDKYFHEILKNGYKYKGKNVYSSVKRDLEENKVLYPQVCKQIHKKGAVVHSSCDYGQLDFLLVMDNPQRAMRTHFHTKESGNIIRNSELGNRYKTMVFDTLQEALNSSDIRSVIISSISSEINDDIVRFRESILQIILIKEGVQLKEKIKAQGYALMRDEDKLLIFEKTI